MKILWFYSPVIAIYIQNIFHYWALCNFCLRLIFLCIFLRLTSWSDEEFHFHFFHLFTCKSSFDIYCYPKSALIFVSVGAGTARRTCWSIRVRASRPGWRWSWMASVLPSLPVKPSWCLTSPAGGQGYSPGQWVQVASRPPSREPTMVGAGLWLTRILFTSTKFCSWS